MRVLPRQAITRGTRGVVSEPVIEIEAHQIKSVESQPGAKGELQEVGWSMLPDLISAYTHLHGLVAQQAQG